MKKPSAGWAHGRRQGQKLLFWSLATNNDPDHPKHRDSDHSDTYGSGCVQGHTYNRASD